MARRCIETPPQEYLKKIVPFSRELHKLHLILNSALKVFFFLFLNCSYLLSTIYQGKYLFIVITLSLIFSGLLNQKTRTMAMPANLVMGILAMIFNPCQEMMTRKIFPPPTRRRRPPTPCHLPSIVYRPHLPRQRPLPLKWHSIQRKKFRNYKSSDIVLYGTHSW